MSVGSSLASNVGNVIAFGKFVESDRVGADVVSVDEVETVGEVGIIGNVEDCLGVGESVTRFSNVATNCADNTAIGKLDVESAHAALEGELSLIITALEIRTHPAVDLGVLARVWVVAKSRDQRCEFFKHGGISITSILIQSTL